MEPWVKDTLKPPGTAPPHKQPFVAKASLGQILHIVGFWVTWLTKDVIRLPASQRSGPSPFSGLLSADPES